MNKVLLTGGLGYIGSHVAVELITQGYEVVIVDDLSNSEMLVLDRIRDITKSRVDFERGDIRDRSFLAGVFSNHTIDGVIHLAAKKAVGESVENPLLYYDVNVSGLVTLLQVLEESSVRKIIFSSSCTVYGDPEKLPVTEETPFGDTPSPYGKTKQVCEQILQSMSRNAKFDVVSLRYFNPVGAHSSAKIGELPKGTPNNLVPYITQTAAGLRSGLSIFGGDYDTPDGTAIRDYIHVVDLAAAHVKALDKALGKYSAFNIGTGRGYSVLEIVSSFLKIDGVELPYEVVGRREGDVEMIYGDPSFANSRLDWAAKLGIDDMLLDAWNWQKSLMATVDS